MRAYAIAAILVITVLASLEAKSQSARDIALAPYPVIQGKVYKFGKVAEGVYLAMGDGTGGFTPNHPVIVNDHDVMVVDNGVTPAAARALLEDIKLVTNKPVRYVVNTHYHHDHTDGNSVFPPEVEIIGHESVRTAIQTASEPYTRMLANPRRGPALIDSLGKQIASEKDANRKAALQEDLAAAHTFWEQIKEVKLTPPNVTYTSKLILHKGEREIQLLFLGRGHTAGDTVVFLPKERIVCTGDLMESRIAALFDSFIDEWIETLEALKQLDFALVLPGHGRPFNDKGLITAFQDYLADLINQVGSLRKQGASPEEAAQRVDLTSHRRSFPDIQGPGGDLTGIRRIYQWMDQRER